MPDATWAKQKLPELAPLIEFLEKRLYKNTTVTGKDVINLIVGCLAYPQVFDCEDAITLNDLLYALFVKIDGAPNENALSEIQDQLRKTAEEKRNAATARNQLARLKRSNKPIALDAPIPHTASYLEDEHVAIEIRYRDHVFVYGTSYYRFKSALKNRELPPPEGQCKADGSAVSAEAMERIIGAILKGEDPLLTLFE